MAATTKIKFYSRINRPKTEPSPHGSEYSSTYIETIDDNGKKYLKKTGRTNNYELIQASYESTKIENILKRTLLGDETALNTMKGHYIDISEMPTSMMDAHRLITETKAKFAELPLEVREQFNHSADEYLAEMSTGGGIKKIETYIQNKQKISGKIKEKTEVKKDEPKQ